MYLFELRIVIVAIKKEFSMFAIAVSICLLVLLIISGADLFVSNISSDELSNMGVEKKL